MKTVFKIMGLAAAGCGVLCLPFMEALLFGLGFGGLAVFVCDWEKTLFTGFVALTIAAIGAGGAVAWRARTRANPLASATGGTSRS